MQLKPSSRELIIVVATAAGLLLAYHLIFSPFFPAANNGIGHDYSYFLPNLLDGYYWYLNNGAFSVPWFTAAFCGGVPAFPNPQNLYFSLPQWLSFGVNPLSAVYLTMLLFALLGFAGFYLLLRRCFHTSQATALLGATLFMFNGFFATRMLIGHLTFHTFMVAPAIAWLLLDKTDSMPGKFFRMAVAGLMFAYVIYGGGVLMILPMIIILMIIGITHGLLHGGQPTFWLRLSVAGAFGIALSLAKLVATLTLLSSFERSDYLLPGVKSIWGLLRLGFEDLFLQPSGKTVHEFLINSQWAPAQHEFEYGITLVPLIMLLIAVPLLLRGGINKSCMTTARWLQLGALCLLLLIPLALNFYTPDWNALLKQIPLLGSSSILIRWFCIYIPVFILFAALAFDNTAALKKFRPYLAAAGILAVVGINASTGREYYSNQPYNPTPIVEAYEQAKTQGKPVNIKAIVAFKDQNGRIATPIFRNNTILQGNSQLFCYEPLFGYRLEHFPLKKMRPGPVSGVIDGHFNLKNPACYIYGASNNCAPGDHFPVSQIEQAKALTSYHPYDFKLPFLQRGADMVTLVALVLVVLFLLAYPVLLARKK